MAGLNAPDVLFVGGILGALGYLIAWIYAFVTHIGAAGWTDIIALSVVTTAIIVRLVFLQFGTEVPITHHVALPAGLAVVASGDIWWGLAFAILGIFLGEAAACIFTSYGDTHIDPPAASIAATTTLIAIFSGLGVFALTGIGAFVVMLVIAGASYGLFTWLQKAPEVVPAAAD